MSDDEARDRELVDAILDGEATPAERAELRERLHERPEIGAELGDLRAIASRLREAPMAPDMTASILARLNAPQVESRGARLAFSVAAAAAFFLAVGSAFLFLTRTTDTDAVSDASMASNDASLAPTLPSVSPMVTPKPDSRRAQRIRPRLDVGDTSKLDARNWDVADATRSSSGNVDGLARGDTLTAHPPLLAAGQSRGPLDAPLPFSAMPFRTQWLKPLPPDAPRRALLLPLSSLERENATMIMPPWVERLDDR